MVVIQRNLMPPNGSCSNGSQLPMGNDDSPLPILYYRDSRNPVSEPRASISSSSFSRWSFPLVYLVTVISWLSALRFNRNLKSVSAILELKLQSLTLQKEQTTNLIDDAKDMRDSILRQNRKQQRTKRLFEHEARMSEELYEMKQTNTQENVSKLIEQRKNGITTSWAQQRQEALHHKMLSLQSVVQGQSRKQVLEKYGPGPHRVQFDVMTGHDARTPGSFIVELAPIDLVPHSIEVFLNMATNQLWDNTLFYHHSSQEHVVAAAPVNYGTFDSKKHHFEAMGYSGLSFPEYSASFPHTMYTLGFAGKGPNFYINTVDNSKHHGPGSQGHHELPSDGDPCFGSVQVGQEVIQEMIKDRSQSSLPRTWEDFDISRIVRIKLL